MSESFVDIRYSKDGGRNWSNWKQRSLGDTGDFMQPAIVRRLGMGRQFVFEIRDSSDRPADLLAMSIQLEGEA